MRRRIPSHAAWPRRRNEQPPEYSSLLHLVKGLHVDVRGTKDGDEQNNGKGRGIAGPPFLECGALQGDRDEFRRRAGSSRCEQVTQVDHLESLNATQKDGEHEKWQ